MWSTHLASRSISKTSIPTRAIGAVTPATTKALRLQQKTPTTGVTNSSTTG